MKRNGHVHKIQVKISPLIWEKFSSLIQRNFEVQHALKLRSLVNLALSYFIKDDSTKAAIHLGVMRIEVRRLTALSANLNLFKLKTQLLLWVMAAYFFNFFQTRHRTPVYVVHAWWTGSCIYMELKIRFTKKMYYRVYDRAVKMISSIVEIQWNIS